MARATTTGISGSAPENAGAVAAGQDAAESAPTVADGDAPQSKTVTEEPVAAAEASSTNVEAVGSATAVEPTVAAEEFGTSEDAEGGKSFTYGQTEGDEVPDDAKLAEKIALHDAALRQENPDAVVYRDAGSAGEVGGESFDYGRVAD